MSKQRVTATERARAEIDGLLADPDRDSARSSRRSPAFRCGW